MAATVLPLAQPAGPLAWQMRRDLTAAHAVKSGSRIGPRAVTYTDLLIHEDAIRSGESRRIDRSATTELHAIKDSGRVFYAVWSIGQRAIFAYLASPREFVGRARRTGGH